jgi:hypothetical protein
MQMIPMLMLFAMFDSPPMTRPVTLATIHHNLHPLFIIPEYKTPRIILRVVGLVMTTQKENPHVQLHY